MKKIGRNDPCHCNSGKKYKKCCLSTDLERGVPEGRIGDVNQELQKALAGQQFESLDDMQVFVDHKIQQGNEMPQVELGGFSPDQLQRLLYAPMKDQEMIQWHNKIDSADFSNAPIMVIFHSVRNYLSSNKAKATARGNLPRVLVIHVLEEYKNKVLDKKDVSDFETVYKESDFRELYIGRLIFELAGLIRKTKGHFVLTQKATKFNDGELFKYLLQTYMEKYNWAFEDAYSEVGFYQTATWYSLVSLARLNNELVSKEEFAEDFIEVFPVVVKEFEDSPYQSSLSAATFAYTVRTIDRFFPFFGLLTLEGERYTRDFRKAMKATPLLEQVFAFKIDI